MVVRYTSACRIFVGKVVHSKSLGEIDILPHGVLGVAPDGSIAFLHENPDSNDLLREVIGGQGFDTADVIQLKPSQFLFPGMIDTHLHAPQWPNLALGMEGTLRDWASYSDSAKARRVYEDVAKTTLMLGSTTVAYNSTIHDEATNILAESCYRAGQRAIIGKSCIVHGSTHHNWEESDEASLAASARSIAYIRRLDPHRRLIHPCVQPRGGPYCGPALMRQLGDQARLHDTHVQAHMCETPSDIARTLLMHPEHASYSAMYRASGLLGPRSIMAHCIHLQPADVANLARSGAGVAHNPNSNTCLRDGECRVRELLDAGVKVGLGTDCSAGYMPSILDAMRSASNVSRHLAMRKKDDRFVLAFSELIYLATRGGAAVVGMEDRIGSFEPGKRFDALVVDVADVISAGRELWPSSAGKQDIEAMLKKWVFLGDDRTIRKVYVDGRLVAGHDL